MKHHACLFDRAAKETLLLVIAGGITPRMDVSCKITRADGSSEEIPLTCRIDTIDEAEYYRHGGIPRYVLRNLAKQG